MKQAILDEARDLAILICPLPEDVEDGSPIGRMPNDLLRAATMLGILSDQLRRIRLLVDCQATYEGLWFVAETATEAYLQQELRRLHATIEGRTAQETADEAAAHRKRQILDPRDPDPSRPGMFRDHNCWKCQDGSKPCVVGNPCQCEYPHARND